MNTTPPVAFAALALAIFVEKFTPLPREISAIFPATLAGNFTVLGSVANLIVVQKAAARGLNIAFWDYFKVGGPLTVLSIIFGALWLAA